MRLSFEGLLEDDRPLIKEVSCRIGTFDEIGNEQPFSSIVGLEGDLRSSHVRQAQSEGKTSHTHNWLRLRVVLQSLIEERFPFCDFEAGFAEEDPLWKAGLGSCSLGSH